jgi:hypothetical protein
MSSAPECAAHGHSSPVGSMAPHGAHGCAMWNMPSDLHVQRGFEPKFCYLIGDGT